MNEFAAKKEKLNAVLTAYLKDGLILALSGGVDSALLLACVGKLPEQDRKRFLAVTFQTILYPAEEIETAGKLCSLYGLSQRLVKPPVQIPDSIRQNPQDRCYRCKKNLFQQVLQLAQAENYKHIIDGTNADDLKVYRPGKKALEELGVESPLAECGLTKAEIRAYARELGLFLADKPSGSCYATRFPYGDFLDESVIRRLAELEEFFRSFGLSQIRVRFHQPILRVELLPEEFACFLARREEAIAKAIELGFVYLTLDVAGFRSGSMDIELLKQKNEQKKENDNSDNNEQ